MMVFHFDTFIRQLMVFRNDERMEETLHNSGYYKSDGDIGEQGGRTLVRELSNFFIFMMIILMVVLMILMIVKKLIIQMIWWGIQESRLILVLSSKPDSYQTSTQRWMYLKDYDDL